jgi:hypothetical protein
MADITDPKALRFTGMARELAGEIEECIRKCIELNEKWYAENAGAVVLNTADLVADGVVGQPVVGSDVVGIIVRAGELIAWSEGSGGAIFGTVLKVSNRGIE